MSSPKSGKVQWLSAEERDAWLALAGMMTKLPSALDAHLQADADISFFEYMVLAILSEQPDRSMQMSEIAEFVSASLSRLSHTAARLEKGDLITREQVPGHGRRTRAILTTSGFAKVKSTAPSHVMQVRHLVFDQLSAKDVAALARIGAKVMAAIEHSAEV